MYIVCVHDALVLTVLHAVDFYSKINCTREACILLSLILG